MNDLLLELAMVVVVIVVLCVFLVQFLVLGGKEVENEVTVCCCSSGIVEGLRVTEMPYNPQHFYSIVAALGFDQLLSFPCSIEIGRGEDQS